MKAAFVIKSLQVGGGGAERVLTTVVNALADRGHDISTITLDRREGVPFYPLRSNVQRLDLNLAPPGVSTPRGSLVLFLPRFRRAIARLRPDVVVAFMHSMYAPAAVALLGSRVPLVASEHIDAAHYVGRSLEGHASAIGRDLAAAITVPANAIRNDLTARWQKKTVVIANPLDLSDFQGGPRPPESPPFVALAVGRFMEQKNHAELIDAFARIAGRFPEWTLRIVGDGELRPALERQIADLGLSSRVELPGITRDMAAQYRLASFVVMPSLYESFGLVTAEALASSRAVLGFAECVGTAELIEAGVNGILLPANGGHRVDLLADGMARLMSDAALRERLGANGPQSVRKFEYSEIVDTWEELLDRVADRRVSMSGAPAGSNRR